MTGDARKFKSIDNHSEDGNKITFGNSTKGTVRGLGKIAITNDLSISNVALVDTLNYNLLSVAQICDLGYECTFGVNDVRVVNFKDSSLVFKGFRYENLYLVDFDTSEVQISTCLI